MDKKLKWHEVVGGLVISIIAIAYLAANDMTASELSNNDPAPVVQQIPNTQQPQVAYNVNQTDQDNYAMVMELALRGNYQAQRNVAYGFAAMPYKGQIKNPVLACAWYLVVLNSGSEHLDISDSGNADTYCGLLDADLLNTAKIQASKFSVEIAKNAKHGKLD